MESLVKPRQNSHKCKPKDPQVVQHRQEESYVVGIPPTPNHKANTKDKEVVGMELFGHGQTTLAPSSDDKASR